MSESRRSLNGRVINEVTWNYVESKLRLDWHPVLTITSDNDREFAHHETIAKQLQAGFYFAHPYASYERGTNENTNGLTRQYFPKK